MKRFATWGGWVCAVLASVCAAVTVVSSDGPPALGLRYLNPPALPAPMARYTHAVTVPQGEELIFVSGQGGMGQRGELMSEGVVEQTRQTMENLKVVLEAAGSDFSHVVRMNIYLTDISQMPEVRKVRDAYLDPKRAPAMTTVKVSELVIPGGKVEIEVVAAKKRN